VFQRDPLTLVSRCAWLLCVVAPAVIGCAKSDAQLAGTPGVPPVPVVVAKVEQRELPIVLDAVGNVEASSTVSITAQVEGRIEKVHFTEGDEIKAGDLLFSIDAQPYRAALAEAEARLARDVALSDQAKLDSARAEMLANSGVASAADKEKAVANVAALAASQNADRAAAQAARVNLAYTTIRAPLTGRAGSLLVHAGNVVRPNTDTPLVVLRCVKPVMVHFSLPERYLPQVREHMKAGTAEVAVTPRGSTVPPAIGKLTFIDNTVDATTGTIGLKAELSNEDESLWPGQYVDARVNLGVEPNALVVPEAAVQAGQDGPYAYAVSTDLTAELRKLVIRRTQDHWSVIESGLRPGEQVAVEGLVRLAPGSKVTLASPSAAATSAASSNAAASSGAASINPASSSPAASSSP
jgi:multidrug efflux system membrane fusion protein